MKSIIYSLLALMLLVATARGDEQTDAIRAQLSKTYPDARSGELTLSPIAGLYELRLGPKIVYVTADGRYLLKGDVFDTADNKNISEEKRDAARLVAINGVGEDNMVIFAPKQVKHTITVFTDVDCGYCRKLHRQINDYLAEGIRVRYMFFPRSGPNTDSWIKAEKVWCSADRNTALTMAKRDQPLVAKVCTPNPVQQHYRLGRQFGVEGTPAIVLESGELLPGYASPAELSAYLNHAS